MRHPSTPKKSQTLKITGRATAQLWRLSSNSHSAAHFTVDGTLIQAWAASRSFWKKNHPPVPGQGSGHGGEVSLRAFKSASRDRNKSSQPFGCGPKRPSIVRPESGKGKNRGFSAAYKAPPFRLSDSKQESMPRNPCQGSQDGVEEARQVPRGCLAGLQHFGVA